MAVEARVTMTSNPMPNAVQIREIHRQDLLVEAAHERRLRQASTVTAFPIRKASNLGDVLTDMGSRLLGLQGQLRLVVSALLTSTK